MPRKKKEKGIIKSSEIKPGGNIFGERFSGGSHKFFEFEFFYRPVTASMHSWAGGQCLKSGKIKIEEIQKFEQELTRCGISGITKNGEPLEGVEWEEHTFAGSKFRIITRKTFDDIPGPVLAVLKQKINAISTLVDPDKQALDFIEASEKAK